MRKSPSKVRAKNAPSKPTITATTMIAAPPPIGMIGGDAQGPFIVIGHTSAGTAIERCDGTRETLPPSKTPPLPAVGTAIYRASQILTSDRGWLESDDDERLELTDAGADLATGEMPKPGPASFFSVSVDADPAAGTSRLDIRQLGASADEILLSSPPVPTLDPAFFSEAIRSLAHALLRTADNYDLAHTVGAINPAAPQQANGASAGPQIERTHDGAKAR